MPFVALAKNGPPTASDSHPSSYEWHAIMFYVYLLRSSKAQDRRYVGFTVDLRQRLKDHNSGKNPSTKVGRPWEVAWYAAFEQKETALAFEKYLKTASGKAFLRKRLAPL